MTDASEVVTVTEGKEDFETFIKNLGLPDADKFLKRNTLIVPRKGYPEREDVYYFPNDTTELFAFLKENESDKLNVDIYTEDENYRELVLHADWIRIADILVRDFVAPLLVGLLIKYIAKRFKGKETTRVSSKITIIFEKKHSVTINYDGPAKTFAELMNGQMELLTKTFGAGASKFKAKVARRKRR